MRTRHVRSFTLGIAALAGLATAEQPIPIGSEFQVNTFTTSLQASPRVAASPTGSFVVVWGSYDGQDGNGTGVFGQRFASDGQSIGQEFQVNTYTVSNEGAPDVAITGDGDFVVVWQEYGRDGSSYGVFGQRFDSQGAPLGTDFMVNSFTISSQARARVAGSPTGDFVVVWNSYGQDGSSYGVFGQLFDSAGQPVGNEFQVNTSTIGGQASPAISLADDSSFVIVWDSDTGGGSGTDVVGQRFDSSGLLLGGEFQVNTYTSSIQHAADLAHDSHGNLVVVWEGYGQDGGYGSIVAQRFDSSGVRLGGELQVNTFTLSNQGRPRVAATRDDGFVVAWQSSDQDGSGEGVFGQRFDGSALQLGGEFQVNAFTSGDQHDPALAADDQGQLVAVWSSSNQDGSLDGVFGQRYDLPLPALLFQDGFESGFTDRWSSATP